MSCRLRRDKENANRFSNLKFLAGRGQSAGLGVDAEDHDGIGVLVFGEKEVSCGIDGEVARFFTAGGVVPDAFEFASC